MAPFDGKYMTSYLTAIVMLAPSPIINELFAYQIKCQKFDHGTKVLVKEEKIGICTIRLKMFYSIATRQHTFTQKETHTRSYILTHTHTDTHTFIHSERQGDDYRQNLQSRFA